MSVSVYVVISFNVSQLNPRFVTGLYDSLVHALITGDAGGDNTQRRRAILVALEAMKSAFIKYAATSPLTELQMQKACHSSIVPAGYADYQIIARTTKMHVVPIRADAICSVRFRLWLTRDEMARCDIGCEPSDLMWLQHCMAWATPVGSRPQETSRVADMLFERLEHILSYYGYTEREACEMRCFAPLCPIKEIVVGGFTVHR